MTDGNRDRPQDQRDQQAPNHESSTRSSIMIVDVMIGRENEGKEFGAIVLAEGLAQYMPAKYLEGVTFDDHGNISLSQTNLARNMTKLVEAEYEKRQGKKRRVTGVQLGYEARCALAPRL